MGRQFTISQVAQAAELPTTTVRYYERVGLVEPEDRSAGNYRLYSEESLRKLKFIRAAQAIGFTLDDVKALLSTPSNTAASCREVQSLIEDRLAGKEEVVNDAVFIHFCICCDPCCRGVVHDSKFARSISLRDGDRAASPNDAPAQWDGNRTNNHPHRLD